MARSTTVTSGQLKNGMRWVSASDPAALTVSFQMLTLAGARSEPKGKRGIAHLVEHLLFDGTSKHTAAELVSPIYDHGGELNAFTSNDLAVYHCRTLHDRLESMLQFFSEILYHSTFADEFIEKEKEVVLQEISMRTGNPVSLLSMVLLPKNAWAGTPAEDPVGGNEEDIRGITRRDVLDFVERQYRPENIVLSISGRVDSSKLEALLDQYFSFTVQVKERPPIPLAQGITQDQPKAYNMQIGGNDAVVAVAFPYDTETLEKYTDVLSNVLIDTMNSRLFIKLRTELALVYSIMPLSTSLRDVSLFGFVFSTKNDADNIKQTVETTLGELNEIATNGITTEELDRAKGFLVARARIALEDTMTLAAHYGEQLILDKPLKPYDDVITDIEALTTDDIQYAASELFSESRLNIAIIS